MKRHKFSEEQILFLRDNVKGCLDKELTEKFNRNFNLELKVSQIVNAKKRNGYKSGISSHNSGRFEKGFTPWNKGIKTGIIPPNAWEKGHSFNNKDIGTESILDGYVIVKVGQPNNWQHKHRVVWENHHGPIPEGYVVLFGDRNKRNFDINNLLLISRRQLLNLNSEDLIQNDADLTRTAVIITDLKQKISERRNK